MNPYADRNVLVVGLARTGLAAARFLLKRRANVLVTDMRDFQAVQPYGDQLLDSATRLPGKLTLEMGHHDTHSFTRADLVVVSPGVPLNLEPLLKARRAGIETISEVELAFRHLDAKVVGVTGSNGKTTTTTLIGHIFRRAGCKAFIAGNLGQPLIDFVDEADPETWLIAELSSFQLEGIDTFRCETAILLNITPDHMDRYDSFSDYADAKARIFENQTSNQYAVVNGQDKTIEKLLPQIKSRPVFFSLKSSEKAGLSLDGEQIVYRGGFGELPLMEVSEIPLKGMHNVENVMASLAAGLIQGFETDSMVEAVRSFKAVEHRLEWIAEVEGIAFYNDSKATNIDSCIKSIQSFDSPLLLILGGRNKGGDFAELKEVVSDRVKHIFSIGESSREIVETLSAGVSLTQCASLREAVVKAFQRGDQGDTVLLAPACASFDMFHDYEHRGRVFKGEVQRLKGGNPRGLPDVKKQAYGNRRT